MTYGLSVGRKKWGELDTIDRVGTGSEVSQIR